MLDRLVEREQHAIIECVARAGTDGGIQRDPDTQDPWRDQRCGDREWAECATRVAMHVDGGPPAAVPVDERPRD